MTIFLTAFLSSIITGSFVVCMMAAFIGSGRESRNEEAGDPEGALLIPSEAKERANG